MENASKALIIAGAILLAILIIGLGVFIYNQASNSVGNTGMDQVVVRQFNAQFEPYINKTIDSTAAKALIDSVNSASGSNIDFTGVTRKSDIKIGHKYETDVSYSNGVISAIVLYDKDGSTQVPTQEHNITESTGAFNGRFDGYIGELSRIQVLELTDIVNEINGLYGEDTVILEIHSSEHKPFGRESYIHSYYSDGKIHKIVVDEW